MSLLDALVFSPVPMYGATATGQIYNLKTGVRINARKGTLGYMSVSLTVERGKSQRSFQVGHVVCWCFHGPPAAGHTSDHINRVRDDNNASNLRWATKQEQMLNRNPSDLKGKAQIAKKRRKVYQHDPVTGDIVATFDSVRDAAEAVAPAPKLESALVHLYHVLKHKKDKRVHGFKWTSVDVVKVVDLPGEQWAAVDDSATELQVSNRGRIKRPDQPGETLVHCPQTRPLCTAFGMYVIGYKLKSNETQRTTRVHLLVASAFIGPRPDGNIIVHIDGNTLNNDVENMCYKPAGYAGWRKRKRDAASEDEDVSSSVDVDESNVDPHIDRDEQQ